MNNLEMAINSTTLGLKALQLATLFSFLMAPALAFAEGRDDPLIKCDFPNDREIIIAEDGDDLLWFEGTYKENATLGGITNQNNLVTIFANAPIGIAATTTKLGDITLTIFRGNPTGDNPDLLIGESLLSWVNLTTDGKLQTASIDGFCKEFFG